MRRSSWPFEYESGSRSSTLFSKISARGKTGENFAAAWCKSTPKRLLVGALGSAEVGQAVATQSPNGHHSQIGGTTCGEPSSSRPTPTFGPQCSIAIGPPCPRTKGDRTRTPSPREVAAAVRGRPFTPPSGSDSSRPRAFFVDRSLTQGVGVCSELESSDGVFRLDIAEEERLGRADFPVQVAIADFLTSVEVSGTGGGLER